MAKLRIKDVMTPAPYRIEPEAHVISAKKMMAAHKIRHLPVVDGKRLLGIVSERDLALAASSCRGRNFDNETRIIELCLFKPFAVDESAFVHEVAARMGRAKIGSALVLRDGELVGIFTAIDACRLLAQLTR